ncbi:MAG: 30S ribosomal protein S8 [Deltaproteobacteria bacterium]|nr:30S ribosomal protein S8 [Deltaproteobacteria bacterium]
MSSFNHLSDCLTRLRNAVLAGHRQVLVTKTNLNEKVLGVLKDEGYLEGFEIYKNDNQTGNKKKSKAGDYFLVSLKYFRQKPVINEIKLYSTPSRRIYCTASKLPTVKRGLGIAVISTNQGIMSDSKARQMGIGGEILAVVS